MAKIDISVVYVYFNTPNELYDSIKSLENAVGDLKYEVIVVDNNSEIKVKNFNDKKLFSNVRIIKNDKNVGYGAGLNTGALKARADVFLLTNPDVLFSPFSIKKMYEGLLKEKEIGLIGPQILNTRNEITKSISGTPLFPNGFFALSIINTLFPNNKFSRSYWLPHLNRNKEHFVTTIGGACMVIKKDVFEKVGGFDSRFFLFFEESDLCLRIKNAGFKILYFPEAKVLHAGGKSMKNKRFIQNNFEKSRFKFYAKHQGFIVAFLNEIFMRFITPQKILLFLIVLLSAFINLYRINELMLFIGDSGRDYLASRDMIINKIIPLVGIPSSVTWLHQGPISIYLIAFSFFVSRFNPVAPAFLYGLIGVVTVYLVYKLGEAYINQKAGFIASLFYATSPLIIVNARMPYHTSSIPFFTCLFLLATFNLIKNKNKFFLPFFMLGLLLQVELSNIILIIPLLISLLIFKIKFNKKEIISSIGAFLLGVLPFLLYDLSHKFVYSIGFPLWIINRIRLFFDVATNHPTTANSADAIFRIYQQLASVIFPFSKYFALVFTIFLSVVGLKRVVKYIKTQKPSEIDILLLWFFIPILGFVIHTTPGTAYFPVLFPAISLLVAYLVISYKKYSKVLITLLFVGCFLNVFLIIEDNYFLPTYKEYKSLPPFGYILGNSLAISEDVTKFIVKDASGEKFDILPGGFIKKYPTSVDPYKYLAWYYGGKITSSTQKKYVIYQDPKEVPINKKIIYRNKYIIVTI